MCWCIRSCRVHVVNSIIGLFVPVSFKVANPAAPLADSLCFSHNGPLLLTAKALLVKAYKPQWSPTNFECRIGPAWMLEETQHVCQEYGLWSLATVLGDAKWTYLVNRVSK